MCLWASPPAFITLAGAAFHVMRQGRLKSRSSPKQQVTFQLKFGPWLRGEPAKLERVNEPGTRAFFSSFSGSVQKQFLQSRTGAEDAVNVGLVFFIRVLNNVSFRDVAVHSLHRSQSAHHVLPAVSDDLVRAGPDGMISLV
jgi:hypothetical protein